MANRPLSWLGPVALPRLILLLNHIVSSEPLAMAKLQPFAGRAIDIRWLAPFSPTVPAFLGAFSAPEAWVPPSVRLAITPAGLFEAATMASDEPAVVTPVNTNGLTLVVHLPGPLSLAKMAMKGDRPEVTIEGDANLAEVASWLVKNLRWDVQDDLARWMDSNTPAEILRAAGHALREGLRRWRPDAMPGPTPR